MNNQTKKFLERIASKDTNGRNFILLLTSNGIRNEEKPTKFFNRLSDIALSYGETIPEEILKMTEDKKLYFNILLEYNNYIIDSINKRRF